MVVSANPVGVGVMPSVLLASGERWERPVGESLRGHDKPPNEQSEIQASPPHHRGSLNQSLEPGLVLFLLQVPSPGAGRRSDAGRPAGGVQAAQINVFEMLTDW